MTTDATILKRDVIYTGRPLALTLEVVRQPDGLVVEREVLHHPGAVAIVPLHADGRVTLVRQYRLAAGQALLEIPAGTLEPGEEPAVCAERELQEEAGLRPGVLTPLGGIFAAPGYTDEYLHLFLATELTPSRLQADADEFLEVVTLDWVVVLDLIKRGEISDMKTVAAVLLVERRLRAQPEGADQ